MNEFVKFLVYGGAFLGYLGIAYVVIIRIWPGLA